MIVKVERLMKPRDVARLCQVSPRTVVRWIKEGKLRGHKVGKLWRIRREDYEEFIRG